MSFVPSKFIIAMILFAMVITGGMSLIGAFYQADPTFIDDTDTYTKFNESFNIMNDLSSEINPMDPMNSTDNAGEGAFGAQDSLILQAWNALKNIRRTFSFMDDMLTGTSETFPFIPSWVPGAVILILIISFLFALYKAIFQREV